LVVARGHELGILRSANHLLLLAAAADILAHVCSLGTRRAHAEDHGRNGLVRLKLKLHLPVPVFPPFHLL
jgi:hypothetical protein